MATVEIDGFSLYYEVEGEGEPLVFAHGVGGNHAHWFNQIAYFSRHYQTIVFDHRGFGNSRDPGGPGRSRRHAGDDGLPRIGLDRQHRGARADPGAPARA